MTYATNGDLADRQRYLNARSTLRTLLALGVVPIINENDTVVTDEIKFGDNDTLGALVANLVDADAYDLYREVHKGLRNALFTATYQAGRVNVAAKGSPPGTPFRSAPPPASRRSTAVSVSTR